ncbi:MAG: COX15/CtaA family protein [Hyphomonadaceae bacterium]|nr:COX15/CtaA family protein [Hyphomonadaceae bacterium]
MSPTVTTPAQTVGRQPLVGVWLLIVCAAVFAMILVGGATRLTDSGLSITEWDLTKGLTPPLTAERWAEEFSLYQRTAEYQLQNRGMSLAEFQYIYWWEWTHRFLGKMLGVLFAVPFFFFWATGRLKGRFWPTLALFALGGAQGAIGWWMVTSGLWSGLDVSPYRLAVHLGMAFAIIGLSLWLALDAFQWPCKPSKLGAPLWAPAGLLVLLFAQILLGAVLAGADGGMAYADWPTIGGAFWPHGAFEVQLSADHAGQQLLHRSAGYLAGLAAVTLSVSAWARGEGIARTAALIVGGLAVLQVVLGILTILTGSHLGLSLTHQLNAALLWLAAIVVMRTAVLSYR